MNLSLKNVFKTVNSYIILATPLILFSLFTNIYAIISANGKLINILLALLLLALMSGAFIAGWFNMIKGAISDKYPENPNLLIKDFLPGVGEYFLASTTAVINMFLVCTLFLVLALVIGSHFIGDVGITAEQLSNAMKTTDNLKTFATSLTPEQYLKISQWNILIVSFITLSYFLLIFYIPAILYKNKNPFYALFIGLKDLFTRKFFFMLFFTVGAMFLYIVLSAISTITLNNVVLHLITTLLNFYFIIVISVFVFEYYNNNFVKSHLGQNIDTRI